jgi:sulfhydrogenase subunit beta (sulfur reductase)
MNAVFLPRENLDRFLKNLEAFGEVYAPQPRGADEFAFEPLTDPSRVAVDYVRTILPPKKLLLPPENELFRFSHTTGYVNAGLNLPDQRVLFGVHTCDIHALRLMDLVFLREYPDPYYRANRRNTAIIGLSCHPDDHCFCHSFGADFVSDGFDLFLTAVPRGYHVRIGTTLGSDIVREAQSTFESVRSQDAKAYKAYIKERTTGFKRAVDTSALPEILDLERDSEVWQDLGERCLGCGACTMVCPTCHCFRVYDLLELDLDSGKRLRRWDSCQYKDYASVAGGHNFRPGRPARIRQRLLHKHKDFPERYGLSGCVGCGRCLASCPAQIDLTGVIKELRSEANA